MRAVIAAALVLAALAAPASAQEAEPVNLVTSYPEVVVQAGDKATFQVNVSGEPGTRVELDLQGVPADWTAVLRGSGMVVEAVTVEEDGTTRVTLDVTTPDDATGTANLTLVGTTAETTVRLPLQIRIGEESAGSVTLEPQFPALRGPSDATFDFTVTVRNDTAEDVELQLSGEGPRGWRVEARPSAERQASAITVEAGSTGRITVTANPPINAVAGTYPIRLVASGDGYELTQDLVVELTGIEDLRLDTAEGALNAEVELGTTSELTLLVSNTGSAPLQGIELRATAPSGWNVTFDPESIDFLAPGDLTQVTATIEPSPEAIAGDYRITFRASTDQAQDSIEVRTTVNPSQLWGLVGVGIIALVLAGLAWLFRRFGRR